MSNIQVTEEVETDLRDINDPKSLIHIVTEKVRAAIMRVHDERPDLWNKSEAELRDLINPSDMADQARHTFWLEYTRAQDANGKARFMVMKNVYGPVMHTSTFYEAFITNPENMAWLLCRPSEIMISGAAYLSHGRVHLGKIVKKGPYGKDGELDYKKANIWLRAYEMLENRVFGAAIQRIEQKTQIITQPTVPPTEDELKELKELGVIEINKTNE